MLMLYALNIERKVDGQLIDRITIETKDIDDFFKTSNASFPFVIYANDKFSYKIELKPNKNFNNAVEFFEYIRPYKEIDFETKEIPTKRMIRKGDIYFWEYKKCKQIYYAFYFIYKVVGDDCYHLTYYTDNDEIIFDEHKADYFVNNCEFKESDETGAYYIRTAIDDFFKTCKIILNNKK